jgi:hypothetical protein
MKFNNKNEKLTQPPIYRGIIEFSQDGIFMLA